MEILTETFDGVIHSPKLTDLLSAFQIFLPDFLLKKLNIETIIIISRLNYFGTN